MTKLPLPEKRSASAMPNITGKRIYGYASRFNVRSENLGTPDRPFYEYIEKGAFDNVLNQNVVALLNHDSNLVLARSNNGKGTLKLTVDSIGLRYEFEAPDTQLGRDLVISMQRGDISSSSFAFSIAPDGEKWTDSGKERVRRITKISRLYDVSVVTTPAYTAADANVRSKQFINKHFSVQNLERRVRLMELGNPSK